MSLSRRALLGAGLAVAACDHSAGAQSLAPVLSPLKSLAPFPIGTCVQASQLGDPAWVNLALAQCNQLTPEWEMKMEYIVQSDGSFRFDRPDQIAGFARSRGLRLYGTTLVWYSQRPEGFVNLDENRVAFGRAYDNYITAVVGRYRGAVGWDVVNEAVAEDGEGLRDSLWSQKLGAVDHIRRAFDVARAADPQAILFLNDYNLEYLPKKLATFERLVEQLLKAGTPIGGIGTQTHLAVDLVPGAVGRSLAALARFGLPIHMSELDVSLTRGERQMPTRAQGLAAQARVYEEVAGAFAALPPQQRFALTLWGLRDKDSWLVGRDPADAPAAFDDASRPKAAAVSLANGLA